MENHDNGFVLIPWMVLFDKQHIAQASHKDEKDMQEKELRKITVKCEI